MVGCVVFLEVVPAAQDEVSYPLQAPVTQSVECLPSKEDVASSILARCSQSYLCTDLIYSFFIVLRRTSYGKR